MSSPAFVPALTVPTARGLRASSAIVPRRPRVTHRALSVHPVRMQTGSSSDPVDSDESSTPASVETTLQLETEVLEDPSSDAVIVPGSFNLAAAFMFSGGLLFYLGDAYLIPGFPLLLLGLFLSIQTTSVRFIFGPKSLSVATRPPFGRLRLIRSWDYRLITNWIVWWPSVPVLAYFREAESYGGRGSVHFFPMVCDARILIENLKRNTPHLTADEKDI